MLASASAIQKCTIRATDGDIGSVEDVYFDDHSWTVRYLVLDTGGWLSGRKVLVSPPAVERVDTEGRRIVTRLSRQQVQDSPSVDTALPVSRQNETQYAEYYGYPFYWMGPYRWGPVLYPGGPLPAGAAPAPGGAYPRNVAEEIAARQRAEADPYLRSVKEVRGYGIEATDGGLGHVEDFLVEVPSWAVRYVVVDPRSWWPGPHVLVSPEWIIGVDWNESKVHVDVTREAVRRAPPYRRDAGVDREYEATLHAHYRRPGYWDRTPESWRLRPPAA
jgi:hypothetical protein